MELQGSRYSWALVGNGAVCAIRSRCTHSTAHLMFGLLTPPPLSTSDTRAGNDALMQAELASRRAVPGSAATAAAGQLGVVARRKPSRMAFALAVTQQLAPRLPVLVVKANSVGPHLKAGAPGLKVSGLRMHVGVLCFGRGVGVGMGLLGAVRLTAQTFHTRSATPIKERPTKTGLSCLHALAHTHTRTPHRRSCWTHSPPAATRWASCCRACSRGATRWCWRCRARWTPTTWWVALGFVDGVYEGVAVQEQLGKSRLGASRVKQPPKPVPTAA